MRSALSQYRRAIGRSSLGVGSIAERWSIRRTRCKVNREVRLVNSVRIVRHRNVTNRVFRGTTGRVIAAGCKATYAYPAHLHRAQFAAGESLNRIQTPWLSISNASAPQRNLQQGRVRFVTWSLRLFLEQPTSRSCRKTVAALEEIPASGRNYQMPVGLREVVENSSMNNQQTSRPNSAFAGASKSSSSPDAGSKNSDSSPAALRAKAGEAVAKATDIAQQAGNQARQAASSLAADANARAKGFLNQRVSSGAELAGQVADSARCAADKLNEKAPQLAEFVRSAAGRVDQLSDQMRDKTVDELLRNASDFTRKQPALVFGLASLAGFLLLRVLKANPEAAAGAHVGQSMDHAGQHYG
jgi:ElaB/YqjD/DUF883 family membrane-anchored ribosome-binding protein